jgi:hypothetical protein
MQSGKTVNLPGKLRERESGATGKAEGRANIAADNPVGGKLRCIRVFIWARTQGNPEGDSRLFVRMVQG